jgi:hypothetical protein
MPYGGGMNSADSREPERKPPYDPVHWQLQRERLHLEAARPSRPRRCIMPLADLLPTTMAEVGRILGIKHAELNNDLEAHWTAYVGAFYGAHTRPGQWKEGVLTVYVDHPAYMNELIRYGKKKFLLDLQKAVGPDRIRDVVFRPDPGHAGKPTRRAPSG